MLLLWFRHLNRDRFDLTLACPPGTWLAKEATALGVRVVTVPLVRELRPLVDLRGLLRLLLVMRRDRYAIVHSHSAKAGALGRMAAFLAGVPISVYTPHAFSYLSQQGLARRFFLAVERALRRFTSTVIAVSESERRRAVEEVGFVASRVVTIPNSVDRDEAAAATSVADPAAKTVLTAGRLTYQKNPEMFVRMAKLVISRVPHARFVMLGAGFNSPEEPAIRDLVRQGGLDGSVEILPWSNRQETLQRIASCSVFVLTSRYEGMPYVALEAMMTGRPLVVTDVDGSRDLVENGVNGFAVPLDDELAMADAVTALLEDREMARGMGAHSLRLARDRYPISRSIAMLEALYEKLISGQVAPFAERASE